MRLDPIRGREQAGTRPAVVVSRDELNRSGWSLCLAVPPSTRDRGAPLHVEILPPAGAVRTPSHALVDQIRALDRSRLIERWGAVDDATHRRIAPILLRMVRHGERRRTPLAPLLRAVRPVKPGGENDEQEERRHAEQRLPRDEERDAAYYARRENQALARHGVHARTSAPVPPM